MFSFTIIFSNMKQFFLIFGFLTFFSCGKNEDLLRSQNLRANTEVYKNDDIALFPHLRITELTWDFLDSSASIKSNLPYYNNSQIIDFHFDGNSIDRIFVLLASGSVIGLSLGMDKEFYINTASSLSDYRERAKSYVSDVYGDGFVRNVEDSVTPRHFLALLCSGLRRLQFKNYLNPTPVEPRRVATCFGYGTVFSMRACAQAHASSSCPDGYVKTYYYENESQSGCSEVTFYYHCKNES